MSLTLVTALTSFRVLAGVVGVAYALNSNQEGGKFKFDELQKAIFGEAIGGLFADWFNKGNSLAYKEFLKRIEKLDPNSLNHDLQRAAAKAQILATFFAVQSCLTDIKSERTGLIEKFRNRYFKPADLDWLSNVSKSLREDLSKVETETFDTNLDYKEIFAVFDQSSVAHYKITQRNVAKQLKEAVLNDIKNRYYEKYLGIKSVEFSQNGFDLLKDKIEKGWKEISDEAAQIVQLKIKDRKQTEYEWFGLVCLFFNEEYKSNSKVQAALDKQDRLEQKALLQNVSVNLQTSFGLLQTEIKDLVGEVLQFKEELFSRLDSIEGKQDDANEKLDVIIGKLDDKPSLNQQIACLNLPDLTVEVYDRVDETAAVLRAMCDDRERFHLVVAPSGFGKIYLLTKVLQKVTDGALILPAFQTKVQRIIRFDCGSTRTISRIVSDFADLLGVRLDYNPQEGEKPAEWINKHLFGALKDIGTIWLVLENFESWLDSKRNYAVAEAEPRAFLNALFEGNHNLRALVLSQSEPEDHFNARLHKLTDVKQKLKEGLPKADALDYLRTKGAEAGLDRADEVLLVRFLEDVCYIPQAVSSLVNYLTAPKIKTLWAAKNITFAKFMNDDELWAKFDAYEHDRDEERPEIRRTKALIAAQIKAQSEDLQRLLRAMAFFNRKVPYEALEALFDDEEQAAEAIARLFEHGLATVTEDVRRTRYYELHAYFREQARKSEVLPVFEDFSDETLENYAAKLLYKKGNEAYDKNFFRRAIDLYGCAGQIYGFLFEKRGGADLENQLAGAFNGKGIALDSLGRLLEAIDEFDKAISILRRLVEEENRDELANDLATALMNKGNALANLGKLTEAVFEYDNSERVRESCLQRGEFHVLPDFVKNVRNRVQALIKLEDWERAANDAINALELALPLFERDDFSDHFKQQIGEHIGVILYFVQQVSPDDREKIYAAAGEAGEALRQLVESNQ
ncbi:MAG TPA: hypothetical protein VF596_09290 [Pyrinomonadaceae bacterium]|jgi:tetratricopeptide (TPR) repeat protein